jgi:hypothetical protein
MGTGYLSEGFFFFFSVPSGKYWASTSIRPRLRLSKIISNSSFVFLSFDAVWFALLEASWSNPQEGKKKYISPSLII